MLKRSVAKYFDLQVQVIKSARLVDIMSIMMYLNDRGLVATCTYINKGNLLIPPAHLSIVLIIKP